MLRMTLAHQLAKTCQTILMPFFWWLCHQRFDLKRVKPPAASRQNH